MAISGNLRTMSPGDLLQWLSLAQKTGTLVVSSGSIQKKIFFQKGRVISSASNDPREYLGQFLMSHGYVSEEELKKAMEVQEQSKILLGKILVTINAISEKDLIRLMRMKAEEAIYDIFLWHEGDFHFIDNELPQMEMIALQIDVTGIILEGSRRIDEWKRIKDLLPTIALVPVWEKLVDPAQFTEAERKIVETINGKRSVAEIMLESRSSEFVVSKVIADLVRQQVVGLSEPAPVPKSPEKITAEIFTTPESEIDSLLNRAQGLLKTGEFDKGLRLLKAAQNLEPDSAKVASAMKGAEALIINDLQREGIIPSRVPRLAKDFDEISKMNFTPNEGFILSRINGMWDIKSIIKISPMREIDAFLIFRRLMRDAIIDFAG